VFSPPIPRQPLFVGDIASEDLVQKLPLRLEGRFVEHDGGSIVVQYSTVFVRCPAEKYTEAVFVKQEQKSGESVKGRGCCAAAYSIDQ